MEIQKHTGEKLEDYFSQSVAEAKRTRWKASKRAADIITPNI